MKKFVEANKNYFNTKMIYNKAIYLYITYKKAAGKNIPSPSFKLYPYPESQVLVFYLNYGGPG